MSAVSALSVSHSYKVILEWTTSLDTSSSTLFVCRGPGTGERSRPGTVSSGMYRPPQVIPAYPPGGDTRICSRFPRGHYLLWLVGLALYNIVVRIMVRVDVRVRVTQG